MIDDDPRIDPADLRGVRFPGSRRRYEAPAVDQFLASLVDRIAATNALIDDLRRELDEARAAGSAQESAEPSSPFEAPDLSVLTDDELVGLVGAETAHVLSTARRAAEEIRTKAEESAARVIREATTEARQTVDDAEARAAALVAEAETAHEDALAEARTAAADVRAAAAEEVDAIVASARQRADESAEAAEAARQAADADADRIRADARAEGRTMVNEAKAVRSRVLDDLQRRRSIARTQIETLLAGRARLLAAYEQVRVDLDTATAELEAAGPDLADHDDAADDALIDSLADDESESDENDELAEAAEAADAAEADDRHESEALDAADPADDAPVVAEPPGPAEPTDLGVVDESVGSDDAAPVGPDAEDPRFEAALAEGSLIADDESGGASEDGFPAAPETDSTDDGVEPTEERPLGDPVDETAPGDAPVDESHAGETPAGEEPRDVDALFARIKAERAESVARAQRVLSGGAAETVPAPPPEPEPEPETPDADAGAVDEPDTGEPDTGEPDTDTDAPDEASPDERDVDAVPAGLLASGPVFERRVEVIDRLDAQLSRALKRHLADEQNEVLDGLRRTQSTAMAELLPEPDDHVAGYAAAARAALAEAAADGAATVDPDATVDVEPLALQLGAALVEPFRRRLERAAEEVDGDADELDERLRAVYREWKVSHIGAATTDALLSAYAHGQMTAAPAGAAVRWRIDPAQGPCPDAQDNALAGAVQAGESFPTGDACPQAHPGCRCLLVVDV